MRQLELDSSKFNNVVASNCMRELTSEECKSVAGSVNWVLASQTFMWGYLEVHEWGWYIHETWLMSYVNIDQDLPENSYSEYYDVTYVCAG